MGGFQGIFLINIKDYKLFLSHALEKSKISAFIKSLLALFSTLSPSTLQNLSVSIDLPSL